MNAPRALAPPALSDLDRGADGRALPGLRDRSVRLLLLLVAALQGYSWWLLEGYQLADSVEYMERALSFVRGEEMIDSHAIRSFGFSSLLVPFFALWDLLGIQDMRPLVDVLRLFQVGLGLALVLVCTRLGARLGGRTTGLAAGFLVGVNPIFLQYTVSPLSGIAAALFVGLALSALASDPGPRRAMIGGAWLGLAFLMAYQTVIIIAPVVAFVFLRGRWRRVRSSVCVLAGLVVAVLLQVALDKFMYGAWGASLFRWMIENGGFNLARVLDELGMRELAYRVYDESNRLLQRETGENALTTDPRQKFPPLWYLSNLPSMLVWPVIGFAALGVARAVRRPSWRAALPVFVVGLNVVLMSFKGSKSFRLWLPLLPMLAPLCAWGFELLYCASRTAPVLFAFLRRAAAALGLVAALVLGLDTLDALNTRRFGVYWEAMRIVNDETARAWDARVQRHAESGAEGSVPRARASAAYHWAMYLRESPQVESVKLPHNLDQWRSYDDEQRAEDYETLETLDWFLLHLPVLHLDPALTDFLNAHFAVHAALFHRDVARNLGPVFVLRRRMGGADERTFYEVRNDADPDAWAASHALLGRRARFRRVLEDGHIERLLFLGFEYATLPGDDFGWISYHWFAESDLRHDYTVVDRITSSDEREAWQNNHRGANGAYPTFAWRAGTLVRESFLVVPAYEPFRPGGYGRYLGGPWRRGDRIPVKLWIEIAEFGADGRRLARMEPWQPDEDGPIGDPGPPPAATPDGWELSVDGLLRVGGLLLPVHPDASVPDDGRPIE